MAQRCECDSCRPNDAVNVSLSIRLDATCRLKPAMRMQRIRVKLPPFVRLPRLDSS